MKPRTCSVLMSSGMYSEGTSTHSVSKTVINILYSLMVLLWDVVLSIMQYWDQKTMFIQWQTRATLLWLYCHKVWQLMVSEIFSLQWLPCLTSGSSGCRVRALAFTHTDKQNVHNIPHIVWYSTSLHYHYNLLCNNLLKMNMYVCE